MAVGVIDLLYTAIATPVSRLATAFLGLFSPRWRRWRSERASWREHLADLPTGTRLWLHAASMGEFEQLVPIIDQVRRMVDEPVIVVTITSLSGIDHARSTPGIDRAIVLPVDSPSTMRRLVTTVDPAMCVIDRYDLWRNMIRSLDAAGIPMMLVNATAPSATSVPGLRAWMTDTYRRITEITAVTPRDAEAIRAMVRPREVAVLDDTRADRVLSRISSGIDPLAPFTSKRLTIVLGSTWPGDEQLWKEALTPGIREQVRLVIVPHEPTEETVQRLLGRFQATRFSEGPGAPDEDIVVDRMGILVDLYAHAAAAYVGGGFGVGVHSTTEPAIRGIPIACGPGIERSADALSLREAGVLTCVEDPNGLQDWIADIVLHPEHRQAASERAAQWVVDRTGSSRTIAQRIYGRITGQPKT